MNGLFKIKIKRNVPFITTMIVMCVLFFLRDNMDVNIPLVVFLCCSYVGICFFRQEDFAVFGACITLFTHGVQTYYILLFAIVVYLFKYTKKIKNIKIFGFIMLLMIIELLHCFIQPFDFMEYIRYFISYAFIGIVLNDMSELTNKEVAFMLKSFVLTYCFTMVDILMQLANQAGNLAMFFTMDVRFGNLNVTQSANVVSLYDNENMIAMFSLIAISSCIILMFIEKKNNMFWLFMCAVALFFGLNTFSKAFVIVLPFLFLMVIVTLIKDDKISIVKRMLVLFTVVVLVLILANTIFSNAIGNIIERFNAGDITSGRSDLFSEYNEFFSNNPKYWFSGIGLQSLREKTGISNTPHNGLQETVICFGALGIVIWSLIFRQISIGAKKARKNKIKLLNLIPVVAFAMYTQSIQFVRLPAIFLQIIILSYAISAKYEYHRFNYKVKK
nr:hypothetical protein [uncultured Blautia sp.]